MSTTSKTTAKGSKRRPLFVLLVFLVFVRPDVLKVDGVHVPSLFPPTRGRIRGEAAPSTASSKIIETKQADLRHRKRQEKESSNCPAALEGTFCERVARDVPKCFPNVPYNDWVSVHKNVFHVEPEEEEEKEEEDRAMNNGSSRSTKNETYIFTPDTPSLRRSRHDEKAKDLFFKKEREKSESGGLGTTTNVVSEKEARKIWHEKQMLLDKKKKKIKVNGKVFHRGEVPEKDIFGDAWNGKVDGSDDDEKNQRQMFAKRASFKTCAVVSSGAALKGKGYGKTIDEHEVVVRLNNAPTIGYEHDVGSFTTLRLTNTQYEGVREYEDETVLTKWNGNPMDLMRLAGRYVEQSHRHFWFVDALSHVAKMRTVSAIGFGGKELEKWYYDKRPSGKIPKSAWLNSGRGVVKYENWNTVSTNARENALFGAKENRKLAEQPKVKVYGNKDKRIGDMLGIGAGKTANANKKKKDSSKKVAAAELAKKTLEEKLDGLESAEEVESDMIAGEVEDDGIARRRRKLLNMVSHVISRERQCMASLADFGVISIYS
ncbi:unnamed protein product [Bathycoccus prasinos]